MLKNVGIVVLIMHKNIKDFINKDPLAKSVNKIVNKPTIATVFLTKENADRVITDINELLTQNKRIDVVMDLIAGLFSVKKFENYDATKKLCVDGYVLRLLNAYFVTNYRKNNKYDIYQGKLHDIDTTKADKRVVSRSGMFNCGVESEDVMNKLFRKYNTKDKQISIRLIEFLEDNTSKNQHNRMSEKQDYYKVKRCIELIKEYFSDKELGGVSMVVVIDEIIKTFDESDNRKTIAYSEVGRRLGIHPNSIISTINRHTNKLINYLEEKDIT